MSLTKEQFAKNSLWTFVELSLYPVLMIIATPVFCLLALILSGGMMFQLAFIVCLLLSCKLIYFDPTKQYASRFLPGATFSKS